MGVGVSYTGFDGKSERMVSQGTGDLGEIVGRSQRNAMQMLQEMSGLASARLGMGGRTNGPRPMAGSAVTKGPNGICLRGEETNPVVIGKRVYGSLDGRKGYHTLDDIDPKVDGPAVGGGPMVSLNLEQAGVPKIEERKPDDKGGWRIPTYRTSLAAKISDDGKNVTIFSATYESDLLVTEGGRIFGKTKETLVASNEIVCAGAGGGKWEVRPVKDAEGKVVEFLFGPSEDLGTGDEDNPEAAIAEIRGKETVTDVRILSCIGAMEGD